MNQFSENPNISTRAQNLPSKGTSPSGVTRTIEEGTSNVSSPGQTTRKISPSSSFKSFSNIDDYITTTTELTKAGISAELSERIPSGTPRSNTEESVREIIGYETGRFAQEGANKLSKEMATNKAL